MTVNSMFVCGAVVIYKRMSLLDLEDLRNNEVTKSLTSFILWILLLSCGLLACLACLLILGEN